MKVYTYDCLVIGTGAAGYNAACRLKQFGKNAAIVTEAVNCGTPAATSRPIISWDSAATALTAFIKWRKTCLQAGALTATTRFARRRCPSVRL